MEKKAEKMPGLESNVGKKTKNAGSLLECSAKRWQLTENNPEMSKEEIVKRLATIGIVIYAISGYEIGESGTKHIHTFVVFKNNIKGSSLKQAFPRAHIELVRGSSQSNKDYISKDDVEPYEVGECPIADSVVKADLSAEVVALLMAGYSLLEILKAQPEYSDYIVRNFKNLQELQIAIARNAMKQF